MPRATHAAAGLAILLSLSGTPAPAQPRRPSVDTVLDALDRTRQYRQVAISPDGRRVAWVEKRRDSEGRLDLSAIFVASLAGSSPRRVTAASDGRDHRERGVAWSPDGKMLAFLSDADERNQLQLWVAPAAGGEVRRLTRVSGQLDDPRWSPDGERIAFLFVEGSTQEPGALVAYKPDAGVVEEQVEERRIAMVDLASSRVRQISPANLYVYDYDWSPGGDSFAAEAAPGSGTNNYWIAELFVVRADTGQTRSVWKPPLQIANPRFSPDGKTIAVIQGIMSDEGSTGGDIWAVPVGGGQARNLTSGIPSSPSSFEWRASGEILFAEHVDGGSGIASLDPPTGKIQTLWKGPEALASFGAARNGAGVVAVRQSFERAPEVCAGPAESWKPITRANADASRFWGEAQSLHWQSGGTRVQGWLLYPLGFDPSKRYPLAVSVHGGPSGANTAGWPSRWNAVLPSQGYFVFLPNPRGSYGFGEAFTQGNVKDFGHGDLADILSGADEALRVAPVDKERLGMLGWSYGGYMTMWTVTQTRRFAAAIAGAGIVDWRSYYGQNRIDRWMIPFFGASVYDDPAVYAKSSPIEFIKNVKTPTLILHGDRDSEVPTPQSYEFWHALKTLGVPTQLVIYEDEGHAVSKPAHRRDIERRIVAWFDRYLRPKT